MYLAEAAVLRLMESDIGSERVGEAMCLAYIASAVFSHNVHIKLTSRGICDTKGALSCKDKDVMYTVKPQFWDHKGAFVILVQVNILPQMGKTGDIGPKSNGSNGNGASAMPALQAK